MIHSLYFNNHRFYNKSNYKYIRLIPFSKLILLFKNNFWHTKYLLFFQNQYPSP